MRLFTDVIGAIRNRKLVDQATRLFGDLTKAVQATGKAGTITLEVKVKPGKEEGEIALVGKVTAKKPEADIPEAIFFLNAEGDLTRDDPRQKSMPFLRDADDDRTSAAASAG